MRGIPGRKNLIWVTAGFPLLLGRQSFTPEFESAVRELNTAAVSVYPVDARGLLALAGGRLSSDASAMMRQLAQRTGGRAFEGRELVEAGPQRVKAGIATVRPQADLVERHPATLEPGPAGWRAAPESAASGDSQAQACADRLVQRGHQGSHACIVERLWHIRGQVVVRVSEEGRVGDHERRITFSPKGPVIR